MTDLTKDAVSDYVRHVASDEPTYLKAHEIAADLNASPKAVGQYLQQLQDDLTVVTLEPWDRSKSITWCIRQSNP